MIPLCAIMPEKCWEDAQDPRFGRVAPFITCTKRAGGSPLRFLAASNFHPRSEPGREACFFNIHCLGAVLMNLMAKLFFLLPAQPFLPRSPKKAAIICLRKLINHGNFSIFISMEALFFLFLKSLRNTAAVLFQLTHRQAAFKRLLLFIHA